MSGGAWENGRQGNWEAEVEPYMHRQAQMKPIVASHANGLTASSDRMLVMKTIDHLWAKDCSQVTILKKESMQMLYS
ncbi:hypothetical protein NC651_038077 [Populus alba x Populus x berolinensis]|nr:hypothetical protein NC651_038077 [Populus alba x Populus x berolinensis]